MNKIFFIPAILSFTVLFVFSGCTGTPTTSTETQQTQIIQNTQQTQTQSGGFRIYQVNEDGTSQEITKNVGAGDNNTGKPTILEGVKGIIINDEGFKPDTLTIKPGTKVIFQNVGEKEHWPMSDPPHTVCANLDAKKGLAPKETYEFTFEKEETCIVHDHLNQNLKATIIVKQ